MCFGALDSFEGLLLEIMDSKRIALVFLLFFAFYVHGKTTKTPAVTFPGPVTTTSGPDSAGTTNTMYRVVLPLFIFFLIAAGIAIFCWYRAWRRREQKQARDLEMVRVEKPVVQKPIVPTKNKIKPAKKKIKKVPPIIERVKAARKEEEKMRKITSKAEKKKVMITSKAEEKKVMITSKAEEKKVMITSNTEEENIMKRPSPLKRFRKWIIKKTQKKTKGKETEHATTTCFTCRSLY